MSRAIRRISDQTLTIDRKTGGSYVKGRWISGTDPSSFEIPCSIQPISDQMLHSNHVLEHLTANERLRAKYIVLTDAELRIQSEPDSTEYKGNRFYFKSIKDWSDQGNFYSYVMIKTEEN